MSVVPHRNVRHAIDVQPSAIRRTTERHVRADRRRLDLRKRLQTFHQLLRKRRTYRRWVASARQRDLRSEHTVRPEPGLDGELTLETPHHEPTANEKH